MYSLESGRVGRRIKGAAKIFQEFCESSSLHGYPYLYITKSIVLKFLWSIVIIALTCIGIGFVITNTEEYLSSTMITTIEPSSANLSVGLSISYLLFY